MSSNDDDHADCVGVNHSSGPEDHENMRRSEEEIKALMEMLTWELTEMVAHGREIGSPREGYAMILEDTEVLWEAIKDGDAQRAIAAAVGLSVLAAQFVLDHTAPHGIIKITGDHAELRESGACGGINPLAQVSRSDMEAAINEMLRGGRPNGGSTDA